MPDPAETIEHTQSRRSGPRAWRRALEQAVDAGLVPGFNATTQAVIEVIASRMCFDTGHARYVMQDVMERTGLGKTAVTKHVQMLRRAGWLAWVEHGSLRNALRSLGQRGYARTATVYAATIPPAYDVLQGHILIGSGYSARIIVDHRRLTPVDNAGDTAGTTAVENSADSDTRTPSLTWVNEVGQVQVVGGEGTSTADAAAAKSPRSKKRKLTVTGYKITGERIEAARQMARRIRPLINWIQGATLDQLSWVLLDLIARDWSENRIVVWLGRLGQEIGAPRWRPKFPHRLIAAALHRMAKADAVQAVPAALAHEEDMPAADPASNDAYRQAAAFVRDLARRQEQGGNPAVGEYGVYGQDDVVDIDGSEIRQQQLAAANDPGLVLSMAQLLGREQAVAVYGDRGAQLLAAYDELALLLGPEGAANAIRTRYAAAA